MSLTAFTKRGKHNPTFAIGATVFAVAAGLFIVAVTAIAIISAPSKPTDAVIQPVGGKVGDKRKTYTREEFTKLVMGKTPAEVIAAVGRPDSTDEGLPVLWRYSDRVLNPATNKHDKASVYFQNGVVFKINW